MAWVMLVITRKRAGVLTTYFNSILTAGRDDSEKSTVQKSLEPCRVPQLGVALHVSGGKLHTHPLSLTDKKSRNRMVALKHHELFLRFSHLI